MAASPILDPGYRTRPATRAGDYGAAIRRDIQGEIEMVNLRWGLRPRDPGGKPYTLIRSEGRGFPDHRCLIPASEFHLRRNGKRYRFTLRGTDLFYFAGIWRPGTGAAGDMPAWSPAYAVLTVAANPDVAPFHDRQMAVLRPEDRMAWLDPTRPEAKLLRPLPARSFRFEREGGPDFGGAMFDW
jgi:putative SOS response-associated peptidase YedK